ncbi:hypothetical protein KZO01_27740 [Kurthia zopfii]|uniref:protein adenylyltransferase n=1 Tax=Kurthia zopfii TaxID=1650 RepID=A0A8B4QA85_9BACL|nr:hypothetical protein [Kurthia zopfii]TDR39035.1 hypothetical protein DFR61_11331 [Kurthia zopfii]GEK32465.1 hypothetical protein KZO01_27740 [Kurthia zopfii]STX09571.1 cell filamentation protein Fic [Kurthia zopfii]
MDPYIDPHTKVLINKLNISDEQDLINIEAQLLIAGIIDIDRNLHDVDFLDFKSISIIYKYLFGELYSWAGEFRTINIYKNEKVLNGLSINYSHHSNIQKI